MPHLTIKISIFKSVFPSEGWWEADLEPGALTSSLLAAVMGYAPGT